MNFLSKSSGFKNKTKSDQIKQLRLTANWNQSFGQEEQAALYEQLANDFEKSDKQWEDFYKEHQKELENLKISSEQELAAATNMTNIARKRAAIKALDFSSIAKNEKTFEEVQ